MQCRRLCCFRQVDGQAYNVGCADPRDWLRTQGDIKEYFSKAGRLMTEMKVWAKSKRTARRKAGFP